MRRCRVTCRLPACIPRKGATVKRDARHSRTQAERRAQTRAALIAAARVLFAERGFAAAGREDIVERAGVTRGALYHHFSSKEDLFQAVYEEVEEELCEAIAIAASASEDPIEQLRLGSLSFLDAAATPEVRRIVLLDAPAVLPVEIRRALAERYGLGMVREALRAADVAGRLAVGPVDALAPVVLAALQEAATSIADGADPASMRAVVEGLLASITS
jgi:AcrR family transcriptional regulator